MRVVTSGAPYLDIDAYAGCIAYAELLNLQGVKALAVSTAPFNESISQTVLSWKARIARSYQPNRNDTFTVIDISDPAFFEKIVEITRVDAVIDHHSGFEQYWLDKLGDKANIEFIGAACTLVYEQWLAAGLIDEMSLTSARLLATGIIDNTLNFGAMITDIRDRDAYGDLLNRAELSADWVEQYFNECQKASLDDIDKTLRSDTKLVSFATFTSPIHFSQLMVWDGAKVIDDFHEEIVKVMDSINPEWFLNLISLNDQKSYLVSNNQKIQGWARDALSVQFENDIAPAGRLWLRKEILREDILSDSKRQQKG